MTGFEIALTCLALNVFKEARGEPVVGQHAVALVTLNRVLNSNMQKDVCHVVFERKQFSWTITDTRDGVLLPGKQPDRTSREWKRAEQSAREALYMQDFTGGATHYHEIKVKPYWSTSMERVGRWGNHYFYRSKDGNQHSAKRAGGGARDPACIGANYSQGNERGRVPTPGQGDRAAQPESERSWWQRPEQYVRDVHRGQAPGTVVHQYMVEAVRDRCERQWRASCAPVSAER